MTSTLPTWLLTLSALPSTSVSTLTKKTVHVRCIWFVLLLRQSRCIWFVLLINLYCCYVSLILDSANRITISPAHILEFLACCMGNMLLDTLLYSGFCTPDDILLSAHLIAEASFLFTLLYSPMKTPDINLISVHPTAVLVWTVLSRTWAKKHSDPPRSTNTMKILATKLKMYSKYCSQFPIKILLELDQKSQYPGLGTTMYHAG